MIHELTGHLMFISIFYNEQNWGKLAIGKLAPVVEIAAHRFGAKFLISFNKNRGDSLNLSVWVGDDLKFECLDFIHDELSIYLLQEPSNDMQIEEVLLFKNFANNRLHYGIHTFDPKLYPVGMKAAPVEWCDVSRAMLNRLEPEDYVLDTLHTHAVYVSVLLLLTSEFLRQSVSGFAAQRLRQLEAYPEIIEKYSTLETDLLEMKAECAEIISSGYKSHLYLHEIVSSIDKLVNKVALNVDESDQAESVVYYLLSTIRTIYGIQKQSFELHDYLLFKLFA